MVSSEEKARRKRLKDEYLRAEQAKSAAMMPLTRAQLEALLTHLDDVVETEGCDHTLRLTDAWAVAAGVDDLHALHHGLEEYGGFCDCEVVMNLEPEDIFVPVRQQRR